MAELDDWIAPQQSIPSDGGADDWLAPAPETPSAWGDFKKQVSDYTPEGVKNLYNDVAGDVGTPTLQGLSGAATTALGMPIRGVTAGQAGFGTAIDAVMNPLTLNRWGDRAERYYDPIEQRFAQENSGLMEPVNRAMEAGLSSPNSFHSAEAIGNDNLLRRSTPEEIQDFQQTAKDQQLQKAQAFADANPGKAAYSDWMQQQARDLNPQIADQSGGERPNEPTQTPPPIEPDGMPNDWVQPSQTSNLSGFDKLREVYENNNEDQLPEKEPIAGAPAPGQEAEVTPQAPSSEPLHALSGESQNRPRTPTEVAVYHGTNQPFDKFDQSKTIRSNLATGEKENAFYFSDTPETANSYLHHFDPNEPTTDTGQNVLKSFIETKNFKTVDFDGHDFSRDGGVRLASEISQAKKEGYQGLIAKDIGDLGGTQNQYITWTPGTVRSALSDNQLYALNGFHHGPEQAVENFSQNKADAGTWKKVIEGRSGWKDYSDWTGVHDFLGDRKTISKDELLSYMRAHSADLDEKILSKSSRLNDEIGKILSPMRAWDRSPERQRLREIVNNPDNKGLDFEREFAGEGDIGELADEFKEISKKYPSLKEAINAPKAKFEGHKIPGGEPGSYRELLIRQPSLGGRELTPREKARIADIDRQRDALQDQIDNLSKQSETRDVSNGLTDNDFWGAFDNLSSQRHELLEQKEDIERNTSLKYTSKHFNDQELAHIRFDDRVGPNGEKTLFINEIQSDLHQKGRTDGYQFPPIALEEARERQRALQDRHDAIRLKIWSLEGKPNNDAELSALRRDDDELKKQRDELGSRVYASTPNAPFKGDLWLELALKRSLRYAVEHGYDAISWARSDQIAKAVGADPENLKIQYDQKIGKYLDKYTKKWGAKVEKADLGIPEVGRTDFGGNSLTEALIREGVAERTANMLGREFNRSEGDFVQIRGLVSDYFKNEVSPQQLEKALSETTKPHLISTPNPILRITPQMRESVMGGQAYAAASRAGELLHIQRSVEGAINAGREFHNTPLTVHETHAVISQHQSEYPNNVPVGALTSVKPVNGGKNVRFNYRSPDGREFFLDAPRSALFTGRATFDEAKSIIGLMEFGRTRSPDELSRTVGGGIRHELVHALRAADRFSVSEWGSLLDHANNLDVLGWSRYDFYRLLGDEPDVSLRRTSLRDEYLKAYAHITNEAVRSEFMDQEAVAHMVEVYHHLLKLPSDHPLRRRLMPQYRDIQPIMQSLFLGEIAKRTPAEVESLNDNPQYALSDKERMANRPRTSTEVKVYHGTSSGPFDKFEGDLIFFDKDPKISNYYSTLTDSGQRNIPAYIDTKDFKTVDFRGKRHDEGPPLDTKDKDYERQPETIEEHAYHAQEQGYKGLIVKNVKEPYLGTKDPHADLKKSTQYVTWTPGTVRSALSDNHLFALSGGGKGAEPPSGGRRGSPATPGDEPRNSVAKESTESFAKSFGNFWKRNLQPELISDKALQADPRFAKYKAATAQEKDAIIAQGDELSRKWNKVPEKEQLAYLDAVEVGDISGLPDWQKKEAIRHRQMLNKAFQEEKDAGSKAEFVQEYMPHIWESPAKAREFFDSMLAAMPENLGPKWFQNARYYDLIKQGLDNGLKLKVTNPEELVSLRLLAGADMRQRMYLLNSLDKDYGLATKSKGRQDLVKQGWRQINAPDKTQWLLAPDAQPLWQNSVNAKGLWANESPAGTFFRGWMAFKNSFVPIKLALSLFHPLHVAHIAMSTDLARAYKELSYGNFGEAAKNVGRSVDLYNRILRGGSGRGSEARSAWLKPRGEQTPEERIVIDLMKDGGFVPQMSEQLKVSAKRNFQEAWDKSQYGRLTYLLPKHAMEKLQAPIFERWIPNLKAAAYINDAMGFAKREPERFSDPIQRKIALRAIGKSVDNRFGEMFYGGVFWNRTFKDTAIGSFLSLGWNLGFAREFGGGVLSPIVRSLEKIRGETPSEARKTIRLAQNKTANVIAYAATAMAICGAMTYAFTGQQPTGQDFIFPRTGRKNPDGTEHRITTMFYTREVPMLLKHIQEQGGGILGTMKGTAGMLWNKLMIQPFLDMWNNRNYWGYDITDINAPAYKQGLQLGQYILKDQLSPMTMSGANHALDTGGTWDKDVPLSFLGFGPAPSYAEKTATQNRIAFLYRTHVAPSSRPQEEEEANDAKREARTQLQVARQKGDPAAIQTAQKALQAAGGKMPKVDGDISMFKRLPVSDQSAILEWAPSDEKKRYLPYANKKIKTQFAANARQ